MKETNKIGFLFDLDGVLIDSERRYTEIWGEINQLIPTGVMGFEHKIKGTTLEDILTCYFSEENRPEVVRILKEREQNMVYDYCRGAEKFLSQIRQAGLRSAIVTSSNEVKMSRLWDQMPHLRDFFTAVIDGNMVSRSKPDPEGYLKGASAIGASPESCVVFEDSLQGVKAGKAAGAYVVGIAGTLPAATIRPYCDTVINTLDEIDLDQLILLLHKRIAL